MKQLEVQIMGQSYLLGCPEGGESRLLEAVEKVDTAMCRIRDAGKVKARDRIAVLAALNLAFDLADRPAPTLHTASFASNDQTVTGIRSLAAANGDGEGRPDPRLTQLMARLDSALGDDGRLI